MKTLWTVILGFARLSVPSKVDFAIFVHDMVQDNKYFPNPIPPLDEIKKTAEELNALYIASRDGVRKTLKEMRIKERDLHVLMKIMGSYVQIVALQQNDIGDVIITSAGLGFQQFVGGDKRQFGVENTSISGRLACFAEVVRGANYLWEQSKDGKNYEFLASTDQSTIVIDGFEPGSEVYIRVTPILKGEQLPKQGPAIIIVT